jgi:hypothetical protein
MYSLGIMACWPNRYDGGGGSEPFEACRHSELVVYRRVIGRNGVK